MQSRTGGGKKIHSIISKQFQIELCTLQRRLLSFSIWFIHRLLHNTQEKCFQIMINFIHNRDSDILTTSSSLSFFFLMLFFCLQSSPCGCVLLNSMDNEENGMDRWVSVFWCWVRRHKEILRFQLQFHLKSRVHWFLLFFYFFKKKFSISLEWRHCTSISIWNPMRGENHV